MNGRRWLGVAVIAGLVAYSAVVAFATPPASDEARMRRIDTLYAGFRSGFSKVPEVQVDELDALRASEDVVLVDVREPEEQAVSMLPGAITQAAYDADPTAYADKTVVAYCTIGARSGMWAKARRAEGVDARNLAGSVLKWTHAGKPLVSEGKPTKAVHVYGHSWNLVHSDYEAVW